MSLRKIGYFTGVSSFGISDAVEKALEEAGEHSHFEVIETSSSHFNPDQKHYQVTLSTFDE